LPEPQASVHTDTMSFEVVLVTYHSRDLAEELFDRLLADIPIAVVDNASGRDGIPELVSRRPTARYLDGGGIGFARAANQGVRSSTAAAIVFVNPDSAPTSEQLKALVADLSTDPKLAAVSAATFRPNGRIEPGVGGWEPTLRRSIVHALGLHALFPTKGLYARPTPHQPLQLDWMNGACLAVPRDVFLSLGGFDERYFLYNEDMAYGRQIREAGLRQTLRTDILVPHLGGGSGGRRTRMFQMRGASMVAYLDHHNPRRTVRAIKIALTFGTLARALSAFLRARTGTAREHLAYIKGLWRGAPDMT
jgi:GT2 family glycosyltransferase